MTKTPHTAANTPITVTDEIRDADAAAGDDVVVVAIDVDGNTTVVDAAEAATLRDADSAWWSTVALVEGYLDEDGEWSETDRQVRLFWSETDRYGHEEQHATRIGAAE